MPVVASVGADAEFGFANEYGPQVKFGRLYVDEHAQVGQQFGITSISAVMLYKDGQVVETLIGVQPKQRYAAAIDQVLQLV